MNKGLRDRRSSVILFAGSVSTRERLALYQQAAGSVSSKEMDKNKRKDCLAGELKERNGTWVGGRMEGQYPQPDEGNKRVWVCEGELERGRGRERGELRYGDGKLQYLAESNMTTAATGDPKPLEGYLAANPALATRLAGDPGLRALLEDMYAPSATRATAEAVLSHPWLQVHMRVCVCPSCIRLRFLRERNVGICTIQIAAISNGDLAQAHTQGSRPAR